MNEKLEKKITVCNRLEDLPSLSVIKSFERGIEHIFVFGEEIETQREAIGNEWKEKLTDFLVGIHTQEPKIKISRLITDKEIEENQELFEKYARDYKELSTKLLHQLADKFNVKIEEPIIDFLWTLKEKTSQSGNMESWRYFFHGFHCRFFNYNTGQVIETPFNFELEFGQLDTYFFSTYINSTSNYRPLKIPIYHEFHEGYRILNKMIELDRFEYINDGCKGIVVKSKE